MLRYFKSIRTVGLPAIPAMIPTPEYFMQVGVIWLGPNFRKQFLGFVTRGLGPSELEIHELRRPVRPTEIQQEVSGICGDAKPEVSQLRELIPESRKFSESYFARLIGKDGNLWVVWYRYDTSPNGWYIGANPPEWQSPLGAGDKLVSASRRPVVLRDFARA